MEPDLSLAGKMDDWGPFGPKEGQWLLFSVGNPEEGHGPALPRQIDDLAAKYLAHAVALKSGQRYVAHVPYTTDHCGDVARDWSPRYLPFDEFLTKLREFVAFHLSIYREMGLPWSKVAIISTHGGNDDLKDHADELREQLGLEKLLVVTGDFAKSQANRLLEEVEKLAAELVADGGQFAGQDPDDVAFTLTQVLLTAGHASHFEHSIAAALGVLDREKLRRVNEALSSDFEGALRAWPPLGGLGGYLLAGGKYGVAGTSQADPYGLWNCLRGLREVAGGRVLVVEALGRRLLEMAVEFLAEKLLEEA
ncbi:MAG: hypothetical protein Kow0069_23960 [Promethearchaeota archaeon]